MGVRTRESRHLEYDIKIRKLVKLKIEYFRQSYIVTIYRLSGGIFLRKKVEFAVLVLALAGLLAVSKNFEQYVSSGDVKKGSATVVIDAGHGGCR